MQTNNTNSTSSGGPGSSPTAGSSPPVIKDCQIEECRTSFDTWSSADDETLDFDKMAAAGWFNIGGGHVRTRCCGIDRKWKVNDNPILQHALYGPDCPFLKQLKSQAYIDRVQADAISSNGGSEPVPEFEPSYVQASAQDEEEEMEILLAEKVFLKKEKNCLVCEEETRMVVFIPCRHLVCCKICGSALRKCPICKEPIMDRIVVFMS